MSAITQSSVKVGKGDWVAGVAIGLQGARRYWLYLPPDVKSGEQLPLLVMPHGCIGAVSRDRRLACAGRSSD